MTFLGGKANQRHSEFISESFENQLFGINRNLKLPKLRDRLTESKNLQKCYFWEVRLVVNYSVLR